MKSSVTLDVFGVMTAALKSLSEARTCGELEARMRAKRTHAYHALAKALRDAGAPELGLSVFYVTDDAFFLALEKAGVERDRDARGNVFTFYWERADTA